MHQPSPATLRFLGALALALTAACSSVEEVSSGADDFGAIDPEAFEVGSGTDDFHPIAPGDPLFITGGPQGGYHVWLSVRCGACGPDVLLTYGIEDLDTGEPMTRRDGLQSYHRVEEVDGWRQVTGLTAYLSTQDPEAHVGHRVRLWATSFLDDGSPLEAETEAEIVGVEYPYR